MAELCSEPRAKRPKVDKGGRFAALEKLKQLKGNKNKYEVDDQVDDVYEIVDEKDYARKAREKYGEDWIDDDGTGYAEDGRDFFEDDDDYSEDEGVASKSKSKSAKEGKKRARDAEKPAKGKASIRNLFSNAVPRKSNVAATSLAEDDALADILGELKEDNPKAMQQTTATNGAGAATNQIRPAKISTKLADAAVASEYMKNFLQEAKSKVTEKTVAAPKDDDELLLHRILKAKTVNETNKAVAPAQKAEPVHKANKLSDSDSPIKESKDIENATTEELPKLADSDAIAAAAADDDEKIEFEDDADFNLVQCLDDSIHEATKATAAEVDDMQNLLSNWDKICQLEDSFEEEKAATSIEANVDVDKNHLKFWFWEAWEDPVKCPGQVFLFGRTAEGKSICVRVENIQRVLYLLPREYMLDSITKEITRRKVTLTDLYNEFNNDIAPQLKLDGFRSRTVNKKFAYHPIGIDVPQECDYLEVQYDSKKPAPSVKLKHLSIAHIFGTNTTSLEHFLLERKLKGPCWLTLQHATANAAPLSWCNLEFTVVSPKYITVPDDVKPAPPPPISLLTLKVRTSYNPKTYKNELCLVSLVVHNRYRIDKPAPQPIFTRHMCAVTRPAMQNWPFDLQQKLGSYKQTTVHKHDNERELLNWLLAMFAQLDPDLIVTHDMMDCQLNVITERILFNRLQQCSRLGRLRISHITAKRPVDFFIGRIVCDIKHVAQECIHLRSYDLQTLCQDVLHTKDSERMDVNEEDLQEMYETGDGVIKLINLTMQDACYILRLMYDMNMMPLAMQITNICGNTMNRTLHAGRAERNEYLLIHAFSERNYIVPDKKKKEWNEQTAIVAGSEGNTTTAPASSARKKAAYSGGLVLDPIKGLYDQYVLLMDFNSLYPSIIQEYNICFTTIQQPSNSEDLPQLPEKTVEAGILPQQLRRLVESRREVKKLMAAPDLSAELQMQYQIRQLALKLTANSMYGCLGFANSRFFGQHLAALVTQKGREILMNTKTLVEKMNYLVIYGDTDSLMVNTNITDYDQVLKIGSNIKQSVNKMYKQLELDIDGVFSCLLLLKKKKYAAVKLSKTSKGELKKVQEHKGLDIVRRDWSQIAVMVGKLILDEILAEEQLDDKLEAVHSHLEKIKKQFDDNSVPLPMFVITKQLSKAPNEFNNANSMPHVQVALRMNSTRNRRYKKGDMVDYVICDDGSSKPAMQRAYHLDELKVSETLKIDKNYYLAHQIHPVVTRLLEVLEGTDASRIAECLGLDPSKFRAAAQRAYQEQMDDRTVGESLIKTAAHKYRNCEKFKFHCIGCKTENLIASAFKPGQHETYEAVLAKCSNSECSTAPFQYAVSIRNQLIMSMRSYVKRFYQNWLVCDNSACNQNTRCFTPMESNYRPLCIFCKNGVLVRQYSERDLNTQLNYFQFMFDLSKHQQKNVKLPLEVEAAYNLLRETVDQLLEKSSYSIISLSKLFENVKTV